MSNKDKFNYSYSALNEEERREIESIKKQYISSPKKEDKLQTLRDLNKRVNRLPLIISITIGIAGMLVFGLGMAMVLEWNIIVWGVIAGVLGAAIAAAAYPVYRAVLKRNKRRYGQQIIDLSNELLNVNDGK